MKPTLPSDYKKAMLAVVVVGGVGISAALIARHLWKREKNVEHSAETTESHSSLVEPVNSTSDVDAKNEISPSESVDETRIPESSTAVSDINNSITTSGTFERVSSPAQDSSDQLHAAAVASLPANVDVESLMAKNKVSPAKSVEIKPHSAESLVTISGNSSSNSDSLSTSGTFERVPSPAPNSLGRLHTPGVTSPPKVMKAESSSVTSTADVNVVMKEKNDIVVVETEPNFKVDTSAAAPEAGKIVQQSAERPSIAPSPSPPVNQPQQPVVAKSESASPSTGVKDVPRPV